MNKTKNKVEYYSNGNIVYVDGKIHQKKISNQVHQSKLITNKTNHHSNKLEQELEFDDNLEYIIYQGEWKNNMRNGLGNEYGSNGLLLYKGDWMNDMRNGYGNEYGSNGLIIYKGEWENDMRHGLGNEYNDKGIIIYRGYWKNDFRCHLE